MDNIASALMLGHSSASNFESKAKQLILAAEANVARIESQIRDLLRLRDRERGVIASLKQVISPIRKLPAELLVEIFSIVAGVGTTEPEWLLRRSTSPALRKVLVISQVCAHWRQLACTTPQLWNFPVKLSLKKARSDSFLATTKTFLERSAPHPIPILLVDQPSAASPVVDLLFELTPRWKSLVFQNAQISGLRELPMDALKSLVSVYIKDRTDIPMHSPVKVFLGAPCLRTVSVTVRAFTGRIHLPWSQLTRLDITVSCLESAQSFLDILVQCTNIVTADFSGLIPWSQPPISAPVVQLARLESLSLIYPYAEEDGHITPFIACLDLPSLTTLEIRSGIETSWSSEDFTSFQSRSTRIECLEIIGSMMTPEDIISLLTHSPNLVDLNLEHCFDGLGSVRAAMGFLRYSSAQNVHVVPSLQGVSIESRFGVNEDLEEMLEQMMFSRWWTDTQLATLAVPPPVARWQRLHIDCNHEWAGSEERGECSQHLVDKVAQLRAEGLGITLV
ncbi:hypothetical protein FB45DRAFT_462850 [Roridomyces roridus]|uniref:F-box domain-containing protein n=1 Tax=Roridomyces roridus TaxID=1738132 RepID=A0AAD7F8Z7_9AGAR|nr:hypothetical protein FB45DRAFT_462850 [Roridomyces roridus]